LLQCVFYSTGLIGVVRSTLPAALALKIPFYFLSANVAIAVAWIRYVRGERFVVWQPSHR
jgi:hypothetical protein